MTTEVLYRKWRPRTFSELVGQEHVSTTLRQAVLQDRVAHAYLFCGPRGTGKTSSARILAKAANCLNPQEGEPDNECAICQAINEGRFMDLIEVDAASNRGINEIRNIREKVNFSPSEGRFKVYIIDESHMLTTEASNAFLKTLEEPPAHIIFIMCTTEAHKVLPTIISRCQRFDFRRLSSDAIAGRLEQISRGEDIEFEPEALRTLGRTVSGALRDGINLLEQLAVSFGSPITLSNVHELLGMGGTEDALSLVRYLLKGDTAEALTLINRAAWNGMDLRQLHRLTLGLLRGVLVYQVGAGDTLDQPAEVAQALQGMSKTAPLERVVRALRTMGEVNTRHDDTSTLPLELATVEICTPTTTPVASPAPEDSVQPRATATAPPPARPQPSADRRPTPGVPPRTPAPPRSPQPREERPPVQATSTEDNAPSSMKQQLNQVANALRRYKGKRFNVGSLIRDCRGYHIEGDSLSLIFTHQSHFDRFKEEIQDPRCHNAVEEAVTNTLGSKYNLNPVLDANNGTNNNSSAQQSPMVRAALGLGAKIVEAIDKDE